jgi:hypothetical protein
VIVRELHHTLSQVALAAFSPEGCGLTVTELELVLPLELSVMRGRDGAPLAVGGAPFTRWQSGVLPAVHRSELRIAVVEDDATRRDGP